MVQEDIASFMKRNTPDTFSPPDSCHSRDQSFAPGDRGMCPPSPCAGAAPTVAFEGGTSSEQGRPPRSPIHRPLSNGFSETAREGQGSNRYDCSLSLFFFRYAFPTWFSQKCRGMVCWRSFGRGCSHRLRFFVGTALCRKRMGPRIETWHFELFVLALRRGSRAHQTGDRRGLGHWRGRG